MKQRLAIAAALLVVAAAAVVGVVALTGGDSESQAGGQVLSWEGEPLAIAPADLPRDRVAYGTVRNTSLEQLQASNGDFDVRDAGGTELDATVQFLGTFAHGIYGAYQKPDPLPEEELIRLGFQVDLESGETSPLTVSYRLEAGSKLPAMLYYRDAPALELPDDPDAADDTTG